MADESKTSLSIIENVLPLELVEKILKLLTYKDICKGKLICKRWKEIIDKGNLLKAASGKILKNSFTFYIHGLYNLRVSFLHI